MTLLYLLNIKDKTTLIINLIEIYSVIENTKFMLFSLF